MKKFTYKVGFPGWKYFARRGIQLKLVVEVAYDSESACFIATSSDFLPESTIAAEARSWNELVKEVNSEIEEAIEFIFRNDKPIQISLLAQLKYEYLFPINL